MSLPFFTIVISTFNRARLLERALRSCLEQNSCDWEAIVVDDCSPDIESSIDAVRRFNDSRIRLFCHNENRGVCEARNTGSSAARGQWLLFLDDDDEFMPDALKTIYRAIELTGTGVHRHVFAYRDYDGRSSPEPPLADGTLWEYRQYLEWVNQVNGRTDFFNCIHRDVFKYLSWPRNRSREDLFHLEIGRRFRTQCHSDVVAKINNDALTRFTEIPDARRLLTMAPSLAKQMVPILDQHGQALRNLAPRLFGKFLRHAALNHFMAGQSARGVRYSLALLKRRPIDPSAWGVLLVGLMGRKMTAAIVALAKRRPGSGYRKEKHLKHSPKAIASRIEQCSKQF